MFVRDKSLSRLAVTGDVVDLYRTINRARVALEGAESQPCEACVISTKSDASVPSVYVVFFFTGNRVRQVYVPEQQPSTMFQYERLLQETLDFVESFGFMLDSIEVGDDPQRSVEIIKSIPALYLPGIDPSPESHHDLPSLSEEGKSTLRLSSQAPSVVTDVHSESSSPAASPPSDLQSRLKLLARPETVPVETGESGIEVSGEMILDDISTRESVVEDHPAGDDTGESLSASAALSVGTTCSGNNLAVYDDTPLFADFAACDGQSGVEEQMEVDEQPDVRGESDTFVAEVVVESNRPSVPHSTDLSLLATGPILEQIGTLLGSL